MSTCRLPARAQSERVLCARCEEGASRRFGPSRNICGRACLLQRWWEYAGAAGGVKLIDVSVRGRGIERASVWRAA